MTKPKGVFKKIRNKGNRYYRTNIAAVNSVVSAEGRDNLVVNSDSPSTPPSASKKKLLGNDVKYNAASDSETNCNMIINLQVLISALCETVCCRICGGEIEISEKISQRNGLVCTLQIMCLNCKSEKTFKTSEVSVKNGLFDTNLRYFYGLRCIGKGHYAGKVLCGLLNLPSPPTKSIKYNSIVRSSVKAYAMESMTTAAEQAVAENGSSDIAISFDGSWQKRGFQSKNSCASIISIDNGKVLDVDVLTKYCQGCRQAGKSTEKQTKHEMNCQRNYDGTSGGMEVASAVKMFQRSQHDRAVRYMSFLGDGDSRSYKAVVESKPYGDLSITKLECINHVQKRMGTRLRRLKQQLGSTKLSDGLSIRRRLTDKQIDQITQYYGMAIRSNRDNLDGMKRAVWAIYFHKLSTDAEPIHNLCSTEWCKYLKAKEEGKVETFLHKITIPKAVVLAMKPVFQDLAQPELLKKCLKGKTQNANESFNNVVWSRIPKNVFVGRSVLELGVFDAVLTFNDGYSGRLKVLEYLGIHKGYNTHQSVMDLDQLRIMKAEIATNNMSKEARSKRRRAALGEEDEVGDEDYHPGGF